MAFDADDLAAFNDPDMPGYAVATIGGTSIAGRFRKSYGEALMVSGIKPTFVASVAELSACAVGAAVKIGGVDYTIDEIITPDAQMPHMTRLLLDSAA